MKKSNFKGTVRVYEGAFSRLIYGYWEWQEDRNCWICNGFTEYEDKDCERVFS